MWRNLLDHFDHHPLRLSTMNLAVVTGAKVTAAFIVLDWGKFLSNTVLFITLCIGVTTLYRKWFGKHRMKKLLMSELLIIDDDPSDLMIFSRAFQRAGCSVTTANTFPDARRMLQQRNRRFDLVLLDARMQDGQTPARMLQSIKTDRPNACVVIFSGIIDPHLLEELRKVDTLVLIVEKPNGGQTEQFARELCESMRLGRPT